MGIGGGIALSAQYYGGGALEVLDRGLGQHLGERSRALCAHVVVVEAAHAPRAAQTHSKSKQVVIWGAIALSAHYLGGCALEVLDLGLGQHLGERSRALCAHVVVVEAAHAPRAAQTHSKSKHVGIGAVSLGGACIAARGAN